MEKLLFTHIAYSDNSPFFLIQDQEDLDTMVELDHTIAHPSKLEGLWESYPGQPSIKTAKGDTVIPLWYDIKGVRAWEVERGKFTLALDCSDQDTLDRIDGEMIRLMKSIADNYTGVEIDSELIESIGWKTGRLPEMRDLAIKWLQELLLQRVNSTFSEPDLTED